MEHIPASRGCLWILRDVDAETKAAEQKAKKTKARAKSKNFIATSTAIKALLVASEQQYHQDQLSSNAPPLSVVSDYSKIVAAIKPTVLECLDVSNSYSSGGPLTETDRFRELLYKTGIKQIYSAPSMTKSNPFQIVSARDD